MNADELQIRELVNEWRRATEAGEVDALERLMTAEMVFLTVHGPPMSKDMFLAHMREAFPKMSVRTESDIQEIHVEGSMAWCWNDLTVHVRPHGGEERTHRGTTMGIYRKGDDGRWRLHRDANMMGA